MAVGGAAEGETPDQEIEPSEYQKSSAANQSTAITGLTAAELQGDDPERLARRWAEVIERPVERRDGHPSIALDDATLRFARATDGRGEGLGGLDLACPDPVRAGLVQVCGIRFRIAPA